MRGDYSRPKARGVRGVVPPQANAELVNGIRSVLAPANPVPAGSLEGDTYLAELGDRVTALRSADRLGFEPVRRRKKNLAGHDSRGGSVWRLAAPALSGLAVVAVVVGLTLTAGQGSATRRSVGGRPAAAATALPRYYITISAKHLDSPSTVFVRSSLTGRMLGSVRLPGSEGYFASIAGTKSDREFFIVADRTSASVSALYRLRLAADGRVRSFTTISKNLGVGFNNTVDYIALSPDGTRLAMTVVLGVGFFPHAEIVVVPVGHGPARVWVTRQESAFAFDPVWTSNTTIAFLWQDHLRGPSTNITFRSQERQLTTTAGGSNLLSSQVLVTSETTDKLGEIEFAFAGPNGGPIIAATARDVPPRGLHGRATVRLVALSPKTGQVIRVFATRVRKYHDLNTIFSADFFFVLYGSDASGTHVLGAAPGFGELTDGKFTKLPDGPGRLIAAGW